MSPSVEFSWKNIVFTFLPHQVEDLQKLIDTLETLKPDFVGIADIEQYKPLLETLAKYQQFSNVKNVGAAVHAMTKYTEELFDGVGFTEGSEWVQLTGVLGSSAVSAESAEIIRQAIKKAEKEGTVTSKNRWQFLEYLCADYLSER